jgi:hypothetical protein
MSNLDRYTVMRKDWYTGIKQYIEWGLHVAEDNQKKINSVVKLVFSLCISTTKNLLKMFTHC